MGGEQYYENEKLNKKEFLKFLSGQKAKRLNRV